MRVRAVNSAGNGNWDTDSGTPAAPVTVPGAPTGLSVTSGDSTLALSWTASANTGGAPVTSYDVEYKLTSADDSAWTTVTRSGTVPTRFISGLTNGLKYDVRVRAVNSEGGGPWATNSGTPEAATVTVPGAPTGLRVTSGLGSLTVNWNPPVSDGGSAITAYRVEWKLSTATSWPGADKGASDRSHTITGLTNGSEYDVRVRAVNSAGNGPWDTNSGTPTVTVTVPGAPRIDSVTSGDGSLTVNWNPPVSNGGSAITGYRVEWKLTSAASTSVWPSTADKSASDRSHELIGLTNGSEYDVRVRAVNSAGNSLWATDSATPAAPVTVPGAPTIDSVTSGDGTLTLSWSAPADTGGAQITSYDVEYKLTSAADSAWAAVTRSGTMTTQVISGLTNGSEYDVRVRAVNSAGNSLWATDSATPAAPVTVPGAPTMDSVTSGDSTLTVNWSPPASDGGSAITGYRVEWKLHTTSWTEASGTDLGATARSHQITGLTNGTLYDVRVHAVNSEGGGPWDTDLGTPEAAATVTVPGAPTIGSVTSGDGTLTLNWSAPANTGGAQITSYDVEYQLTSAADSAWTAVTRSGTATTQVISGLTNGSEYDVRVRAVNSEGDGPWATSSGTPAVPVTVPGAPTIGSVTIGNGTLTLSWTAPANTGGAQITSYDVQYKLTSADTSAWTAVLRSGTVTTQAISSLTNGSAYDVRVRAVNSEGGGNWATDSGTPAAPTTVPGAPTIDSITSGNGRLTVNWRPPVSDGGSAITGYLVEWKLSTATSWPGTADKGASDRSHRITGLTNESLYDLRVTARNAVGGTPSDVVQGTPRTTAIRPGPPIITRIDSDEESLSVYWDPPLDNGGSDITGYRVRHKRPNIAGWITYPSSTGWSVGRFHFIGGLTNGTVYEVQVKARNSVGGGDWSESTLATPGQGLSGPDGPVVSGVTPGDGTVTVSWSPPESDGGSAITAYRVEWKLRSTSAWTGASGTDLGATARSHQITGLTNGTPYDVRMRAANSAGPGDWAFFPTVTPGAFTEPGAPTIDSVTSGDDSLTVNWSPPDSNGGSAITAYRVEWKLSSTSQWTGASGRDLGATARSHQITSLTNGTSYDARVRASNSVGGGTWSAGSSGIPTAPPTIDGLDIVDTTTRNATARARLSNAVIGTVVYYRLRFTSPSTSTWSATGSASATAAGATGVSLRLTRNQVGLNTLTARLDYTVQASLSNSFPSSATVSASFVVTDSAVAPGAPTGLSVTSGASSLTVNWSEPNETGGGAITSYDVEYKLTSADDTAWTAVTRSGTATTQEITGLTNGSSYDVRVSAVNSAGNGPWATDSGTPEAAATVTVPGAPTIDSVTSGDSTLTLNWTASADTGGGAITSYDVEYKLTSADVSAWTAVTRSGTATTQEITGLTNGSPYDVRVSAVNSAGNGPWATSSGTPEAAATVTVPGAPTIDSVTSGDGTLTLSWTASADTGGAPVTSYDVEYKLTSADASAWTAVTRSGTATTQEITGLTNGSPYDVRVSAGNSAGSGPWATDSGTPEAVATVTVPGAPTIDSVTSGDGTLTLSWTASADTGGAPITSYDVEYKLTSADASAWAAVTRSGTATTQEITGLTNDSPYDVRVSAGNSAGNGPWATSSGTPEAVATVTVPGAPTIGSVTSGDSTLTLSWTASADTGGAPITSYDVEYKLTSADASAWTAVTRSGTATTQEITGLTNGSSYDVRVSAGNSAGNGPWATSSGTVVGVKPGKPTITDVQPGNGTLNITWAAPSAPGTSAITAYRVEWQLTASSNSWTGTNLGADATSYQIENLTNGSPYELQVSAANASGSGDWSDKEEETPSAVPSAPTIDTVSSEDAALTVTWSASSDAGSSVITSYEVEYKVTDPNVETWTDAGHSGTTTTLQISGLVNGTEYLVRVRANNSAGWGAWTTGRGTPGAEPGAPEAPIVTSGDSSLNATWSEPQDTGTAAITEYRLEWKEQTSADWTSGQDFSPSDTSHAITGLENGTLYQVRVRASNSNGDGLWSPPSSGTPLGVPDAPGITDATGGDGTITLSWSEPDDGGSPITGYRVQWKSSADTAYSDTDRQDEVDALQYTVSSLDNGFEYTVRVQAISATGDGPWSEESTIQLIATPNAPTGVGATRGDATLEVSWTALAADALRPVTGYVVRWKSGTQAYDSTREQSVGSGVLTSDITGLANGTEYTVQVHAVNERGESAGSTEVSATPGKAPDAPDITVTPGDAHLVVEWTTPADTDGFQITEYRVQWKSDTDTDYNETDRRATVTTGVRYTIQGLVNGTAYTVRVLAVNEVGMTESDEWTGIVGLDTAISSVSVVGTPTQDEATVAVTMANQDSRQETVYLRFRDAATAPDGAWGATQTHDTTAETSVEFVLSGLAADTEYEVQVSLDSFFPQDRLSSATVHTASTVPGASTGVTLTSFHLRIQVGWTAPADGGSPITGYRVQWEAANGGGSREGAANVGGGTLTHTFTTAGNGLQYSVRVTAINANGEGSPSAPVVGASSTVPAAPENVVVSRGDSGELVVRWSEPGYDGDSAVTNYAVQWKTSSASFGANTPEAIVGASARSHTITGLTDGIPHDVRVLALNVNGRSAPSAPRREVPGVIAGAPAALAVTHGDGQLSISWEPPGDTATVDSYTVEWKPSTAQTQTWSSAEGVTSPHDITGLTNGVQYDVRVIAVVNSLPSAPSGVANGTPSTVPQAPTGISLVPGDNTVAVSWSPPANMGGAEISAYMVQWKLNAVPSWDDASSAEVAASPHDITELTNGVQYDVRVIALNINGPGTPSTPASATPATDALTGISAVGVPEGNITSSGAIVRVSLANQDDASETIHLRYRPTTPADAEWSTTQTADITTETSVGFTLSDLLAVTEYEVQASLDSTFPAGASLGTTFTTLDSVLGAPTSLNVVSGDGELLVSWSPPASGDEVGAYIVQWKSGEEEFDAARQARLSAQTLSYTISGLSNGVHYAVRVLSVDIDGARSVPSNTVTGAPEAAPVVAKIEDVKLERDEGTRSQVTVTVDVTPTDEDASTTVYLRFRTIYPQVGDWSETQVMVVGASGEGPSGAIETATTLSNNRETSAIFLLTGLMEDSEYEIQLSLDEEFPADESGEETVSVSTEKTVAEVLVSEVTENSATVVVSIDNQDSDPETVNLRYRPTSPPGEEWSDTRTAGTTNEQSVTFDLADLISGAEYTVEASLDSAFPIDATVTAVFRVSGETRTLPVITEVLPGDQTLTVSWLALPIEESTGIVTYDLRYIRSDAEGRSDVYWTVVANVLDVEITPSCVEELGVLPADGVSVDGTWSADCESTNREGSYARYYIFSLESESEIRISLTSEVDTYLNLLEGEGTDGEIQAENDDIDYSGGNLNSSIDGMTLPAGVYTVEATTYGAGEVGTFSLSIASAEESPEAEAASAGPMATDAEATYEDAVFFSYTLEELTNGISYNVQVRAVFTGGEGPWSPIANGVPSEAPTPEPTPEPPPEVDDCVEGLGVLPADGVSLDGTWSADCESTNREGSYARYYIFSLESESEIRISLTSEVDTYLNLLEGEGTDGEIQVENDDIDNSGGNLNSSIDGITLPAGVYTVEATTYGAGEVGTFSLSIASAEESPEVDDCAEELGVLPADGVSLDGTWSADCESTNREGSYVRYYIFSLEEESEIRISLTSEVDTYLNLLEGEGTDGEIQAENDDIDYSGGNLNSSIDGITLPAGVYTVEATTYGAGEVGTFSLSIASAEESPEVDDCAEELGVLPADGVSLDGTWSADCESTNREGSYARYYIFSLESESEIRISLTSEVDTYLNLLEGEGTDGEIQAENDDIDYSGGNLNSGIDGMTLPEGVYTVEATTYGAGEVGTFNLGIDAVSVAVEGASMATSESRR